MKFTNIAQVKHATEEILSLPDQYLKEKEYFEKMFPTLDGVRGFRIAGETVSEIARR